jgi:hypothetical protein
MAISLIKSITSRILSGANILARPALLHSHNVRAVNKLALISSCSSVRLVGPHAQRIFSGTQPTYASSAHILALAASLRTLPAPLVKEARPLHILTQATRNVIHSVPKEPSSNNLLQLARNALQTATSALFRQKHVQHALHHSTCGATDALTPVPTRQFL